MIEYKGVKLKLRGVQYNIKGMNILPRGSVMNQRIREFRGDQRQLEALELVTKHQWNRA